MHMKGIIHKHLQKNVNCAKEKIKTNNYIDEELESDSDSDSDNDIDIDIEE